MVYWRGVPNPGLWEVPVDGGEETPLVAANVEARHWVVRPSGIYYLERSNRQSPYTLYLFNQVNRRRTAIARLAPPGARDSQDDARWGIFAITTMTVSPNERRLLYAQRDRLEFDLMLVENFR